MKILIIVLSIVCWAGTLRAQTDNKPITGKVSYISLQNVYVKFESTKNLKVGDTLYIQKENVKVPVLVVDNLSSTSCVCTAISKENLTVSIQIYSKSFSSKLNNDKKTKLIIPANKESSSDSLESTEEKKVELPKFPQKITGSISASSYSNFSNNSNMNSTRFRYQLSINAKNIGNSKISAETYVSFQHEKDKWNLVQENMNKALKIYNLSVKYDNNKNTQIVLGRKTNPKISSIGAIDGLQYEAKVDNIFFGVVAGSRPKAADYSFDFSLPEFGAYVGHKFANPNGEMQNSFAFFEQMNTMKTDRRSVYYQQSNSLVKNLYFFGSVEFELYKIIDSIPKNTFDLSSAYLVLNYKLFKKITLSTSYDNRKNPIYYETYKSYINQMLEIESRQGLSFQASFYNLKNLSFGAKAGYPFPNRNSKETKNLYGFVTYSNIPVVKLSVTGGVNYLETSYVNGKILNLNISREILQGDLYINCGYQLVDYTYVDSETTSIQNVINLSISYRFFNNISFTANYENTFENQDQYSRLNFQIRKRF